MAENAQEQNGNNLFESFFTDLLPMEQRTLLGTLVFFGIILIVGWVAINEPTRMETFTEQYHGRSVERGAVLFQNNCSTCHGADGKGLEGVGPGLNIEAMFNGDRLEEVGWTGTLEDYIYLTVAAGRPVKSDPSWPQNMPTWSNEYGGPLRPDQVQDITNYVMNYEKFYADDYEGPVAEAPAPTPTPSFSPAGTDVAPADLPEGDVAHGEALFLGQEPGPDGATLACQACHSLDGSTLVGPSIQGIASKDLPDGYDSLETYLIESILQPNAYKVPGFENAQMPVNFGERLDIQSLADLIAFLQTQE